jgi:hypothetical protein
MAKYQGEGRGRAVVARRRDGGGQEPMAVSRGQRNTFS